MVFICSFYMLNRHKINNSYIMILVKVFSVIKHILSSSVVSLSIFITLLTFFEFIFLQLRKKCLIFTNFKEFVKK